MMQRLAVEKNDTPIPCLSAFISRGYFSSHALLHSAPRSKTVAPRSLKPIHVASEVDMESRKKDLGAVVVANVRHVQSWLLLRNASAELVFLHTD